MSPRARRTRLFGQIIEQEDGSSFCAHWIVISDLARFQREQEQGS